MNKEIKQSWETECPSSPYYEGSKCGSCGKEETDGEDHHYNLSKDQHECPECFFGYDKEEYLENMKECGEDSDESFEDQYHSLVWSDIPEDKYMLSLVLLILRDRKYQEVRKGTLIKHY